MNKNHSPYGKEHRLEVPLPLLERLCLACAVSGDEGEVRAIVLEQIKPFADEIKVDALGSVLAIRHSAASQPGGLAPLRVMLAAHMDEVGLMLTHQEDPGIFGVEKVGGLNLRCLAGKPVRVGRQHVPGIIGMHPIHLSSDDELEHAISLEALRIDVGPANAGKVKVGDYAVFDTPFTRLGPSLRAKALDNRLGVATLIQLFKNAPSHLEILAAFTIQEELGLHGARAAAYALDPHLAFVLDNTPAHDLPRWDADQSADAFGLSPENTRYNTRLGAGPAIYVADPDTLSDPRLIRHLVNTAEALGIPYQFRQPGGGGTDAGAIHTQRAGIPSVSVSVPGRYMHSPASICRIQDWQDTLSLVYAALERLAPDVLKFDEIPNP